MFLMMSCWSENLPSEAEQQTVQHVPNILGKTLASAGIGITITSLTDFLAFIIGTTSVFRSVTNFSLYAGEYFIIIIIINIVNTVITITTIIFLTEFTAFAIDTTSVLFVVFNSLNFSLYGGQ